MATPIFVTGIGTGVGKTLASAILAEALEAEYWKPVQTGIGENSTEISDSDYVAARITNGQNRVHPECYELALPASPHIAARAEGLDIDLNVIAASFKRLPSKSRYLVVEGAGGLLVPLSKQAFMTDLISRLGAKVVLVSRNYLGSINHSLMTARVCRDLNLDVAGWIFNDHFGDYEEEIVSWSGYPVLGRIPMTDQPDAAFVREIARSWRADLHTKF